MFDRETMGGARGTPWVISAALAVVLAASCGTNDLTTPDPEPEDPNTTSREIGPAGGALTSSDGALTLTIPPGALGTTEIVTVRKIATEDLGGEFPALVNAGALGNIYELGPDGLQFGEPATVRFQSAQQTLRRNDSLRIVAEFLLTAANGRVEALESVRTTVDLDEGTVIVQGELRHFSPLATSQANNGVSFFVFDVPETLEVGTSFSARAQVAASAAGDLADVVTVIGPARYEDRSSAPIVPAFDPPSGDLSGNAETGFTGTFPYRCDAVGKGVYASDLSVRVRFDLDGDEIEATSFADFITTIDCVESLPELVELRVTVTGDGTGVVTSDPAGIDCPEDCVNAFAAGSDITLTATAAEGSVFDGWTGEAPPACARNRDCMLAGLHDGNNDITAVFTRETVGSGNVFDAGVTRPEAIALLPNPWAALQFQTDSPYLLLLPGATGAALIDPSTQTVLGRFDLLGAATSLFGATPLRVHPDINGTEQNWILYFGPDGWYLQEIRLDGDGNPEAGETRPFGGGLNAGITTAANGAGGENGTSGGAGRALITEADNLRVVAEIPDALFPGSWDGSGQVLMEGAEDFPGITSAVIATWGRSQSAGNVPGDLYVLTQGSREGGSPAQLFHSTFNPVLRGYSRGTLLELELGYGARSFKCIENPEPDPDEAEVACFAFMHESLQIVPVYSFSDRFEVGIPIPVDGPVTGDVRITAAGNPEVIGTGFNDGGVYVGSFDWMGSWISGGSGAVPAECIQPGSIRHDPSDHNRAYASCHGSDNVAVVDLGMIRGAGW